MWIGLWPASAAGYGPLYIFILDRNSFSPTTLPSDSHEYMRVLYVVVGTTMKLICFINKFMTVFEIRDWKKVIKSTYVDCISRAKAWCKRSRIELYYCFRCK